MASKSLSATAKPLTTVEQLDDADPPEIEQIPFIWLDRGANKTTKLLATPNINEPVEGQNRWYSYQFAKPIFVYRIVVNETNYPDYKDFEIRVRSEDGRVFSTVQKPNAGSKVVIEINDFCTLVEFKPPKTYFAKGKMIDSVEIYGFDKGQAGKFIQFSRDVERLKLAALAEIEQRETKHQAVIERATVAETERTAALREVNDLKNQSDRLKSQIKRLESTQNEITTKIEATSQSLSTNNRDLTSIKEELDHLSTRREKTNAEIATSRDQLTALKANLDLFPSELSDFVRQGARNNKTLFWLAAAPIAVIVLMFVLLISGAVDLSTKISVDKNINLETLLVSRMPYVLVAITIITACYKIAHSFIAELVNINRQRLNLTKVSIIAKDISNSAEFGSNLSSEEKHNLRLRFKMDLLRDHLKNYINADFEPSLPDDISPSSTFLQLINVKTKRGSVGPKEPAPPLSDSAKEDE